MNVNVVNGYNSCPGQVFALINLAYSDRVQVPEADADDGIIPPFFIIPPANLDIILSYHFLMLFVPLLNSYTLDIVSEPNAVPGLADLVLPLVPLYVHADTTAIEPVVKR